MLLTGINRTAARPPNEPESMPLFSSVSRCKAFSFQGCSILLLPCFTAVVALWSWCPVSDLGRLPLKKEPVAALGVGSGQVLIYAAAAVCEALQRAYSNSLYLSHAITQKAKYKP